VTETDDTEVAVVDEEPPIGSLAIAEYPSMYAPHYTQRN
jgi:hypothetical protein